MIPIYILNLPKDAGRRAHMTAQCKASGIRFTFVTGIDGGTVPPEQAEPHMRRATRAYGRALTMGELGCALSHVALAARIAAEANPLSCVMEDDITLSPDTAAFLEEAELRKLPPFDILRLFGPAHRQHKPAWHIATLHDRAIVAPLRGWDMQAQIYTRAAAARIAKMPISGPIDGMIYYGTIAHRLRILE